MALPFKTSVADLAQMREEGRDLLLLDVRTPAEYESSHIPGSVNVPLNLIDEHPEELSADIDRDTVIICRSGARAQRAQQKLESVGITGLSVLEGGMEAWRSSKDLPLNQGKARWDMERQVRLVAGSIVGAGVLTSTVFPKAKWVSGAIGGGLVYAAVSNSCMMGEALAKLPYNKGKDVSLKEAQRQLREHRGQ